MDKAHWLACSQGHDFPDEKYVLKELCAQHIQTRDFYTFHIKSGELEAKHVNLEDGMNMPSLYYSERQIKIKWNDGSMDIGQLRSQLEDIIPKTDKIIVNRKSIKTFFERCGYPNVCWIFLPCLEILNKYPAATCGSYGHDEGFLHCAQRQCFEYLAKSNAQELERYYKDIVFSPTA
jgi:hypothetical protein